MSGFTDTAELRARGLTLPPLRFLTNAYGLTPIRRRLVAFLVCPTAEARSLLAPLLQSLERWSALQRWSAPVEEALRLGQERDDNELKRRRRFN